MRSTTERLLVVKEKGGPEIYSLIPLLYPPFLKR
jgi:hypothetical protein